MGALVAPAVADSPAEKSGLKRGDIIVDFDGKDIEDSLDLPVKVAGTLVDEEVLITVLRDGKEQQLTVKVGKLASDETTLTSFLEPTKGKWGMQLHELSPHLQYHIVLPNRTKNQNSSVSCGADRVKS